jgi:hypothetical protein
MKIIDVGRKVKVRKPEKKLIWGSLNKSHHKQAS